MRKIILSAILASAVVSAAPAAAQYRGHQAPRAEWNRGGPSRAAINDLLRDLQRAENGIQRSVQRRAISQREAAGLHREANRIERRLNLASRNGINNREFGTLRAQVSQLQQRLRIERRDNDGRRW